MVLSRGVVALGASAAHPFIDFRQLEFPEPSDTLGRHAPALNPAIDRVLYNPEVLRDVLYGHPRFRRHLSSRVWAHVIVVKHTAVGVNRSNRLSVCLNRSTTSDGAVSCATLTEFCGRGSGIV